jgi:ATP/maltotriose-dependent transcriptional regulator MalT/DNA-binding SARP family transcriptional activator
MAQHRGPFATIAKIRPPRLHRPVLRERLFQELDTARQAACVWLGATAGAGKTTLAGTWLEQRKLPAVWLQCDPGDADPSTFFHFLTLAAQSGRRRLAMPVPIPEALRDLAGFARRYFRAFYQRLPPSAVVVLDNFQEAQCDSLLTIVEAAVCEAPADLCVLVISREPPAKGLAACFARGLMKSIAPESLRFSREEVSLLLRGTTGQASLADLLHTESEGWASGITLMLEAARGADAGSSAVEVTRNALVFEYFASQVFSRLDVTAQDILLQTSVLPSMTPDLVAQLTGRSEAGAVLSHMYERKLFTYCSRGARTTYQYHRLFREFLNRRARQQFGEEGYRSLAKRACALLDAEHSFEAALSLAIETKAWDLAASLIERHAQAVAAQCRWQVLLVWIDELPLEHSTRRPWLCYWRGMALSATRSREALPVLERASAAFAMAREADGQLLACSEGLHCAFRLWSFTEYADAFLATIRDVLSTGSAISDATRLRALTGAVIGLVYREPTDALLPAYVEEVAAAVPGIASCEQAIRTAWPIIEYFSDQGAFERSERIIRAIESLPGECSPALRYQWWDQLTWHYCWMGDRERAQAAADRAFHCAESEGLHDLGFLGRSMQCVAAIQFGDLARADHVLQRMQVEFPADVLMHSMRLQWLQLWLHLVRDDVEGARRVWDRFSTLPLAGVPIMYPMSHAVIAILLHLREHENVLARVIRWRQELAGFRSPYFDFNLLLMEAAALLDRGDHRAGQAALREALSIGRHRAYLCTTSWIPSMMSQLCGVALEQGIEVEYVQRLIRHHRLAPGMTGAMLWPRPVKVLTLGQFLVLHDDVPVEIGRKAPRKVFGLLKVVLAHGGRDVPAETVCDLLWPDLEGDAQHVAFSIALHRLRKLLGDPAALRLLDGRITVEPSKVWVDVYALDHLLDQALQSDDEQTIVRAADQALFSYRGSFLPQELEPWAVSLRERIRSRFVRVLRKASIALEDAGRHQEAIVLYQRGIETDCLAEEFYQGLMRSYAALGRVAEAKATFRQLEDVLQRLLRVRPSTATRDLAQRLSAA